jgi:hypothetical protein
MYKNMYAQDDLTDLLETVKIEARNIAEKCNKTVHIDTAEISVCNMILKQYINHLYFPQP